MAVEEAAGHSSLQPLLLSLLLLWLLCGSKGNALAAAGGFDDGRPAVPSSYEQDDNPAPEMPPKDRLAGWPCDGSASPPAGGGCRASSSRFVVATDARFFVRRRGCFVSAVGDDDAC
jgi:hypothetical protein